MTDPDPAASFTRWARERQQALLRTAVLLCAGWLDDDTVVYESRQSEPVLVSWRLGTRDFGLVARIHGAYDVASFAL